MNIELDDNEDVQSNFDTMYGVMIDLLAVSYTHLTLPTNREV